jgi:hypothetical protein
VAINTVQVEPRQPRSVWAVLQWGDAGHLASVGALASAFGGGSAG